MRFDQGKAGHVKFFFAKSISKDEGETSKVTGEDTF